MVRPIVSRRILLVFGLGVIVAVMMMLGSSTIYTSASAQPSGGPTCTDKWFKDWYVWEGEEGPWLYYWWYQYCQDPSQGDDWFRAYYTWEWGEAL